eukprot:4816063-Pyramimonas_sp.AAC.1
MRGNLLIDSDLEDQQWLPQQLHFRAPGPVPKEPVARRGPAPGRARRTGWALALEGRTRGAFSTRR